MKYFALCLMVVCTGCFVEDKGRSQAVEQERTEAQQSLHLKTTPPPELKNSQERKNLIERLERFNTDSKTSYIYLINYGKIMAFYTVKGKVSSVNSLLTTPDQVVDHIHHYGGGFDRSSHVVASPDLDGSYGTNGDAIFFFTTEGVYVEWKGDYMLVDAPLKLTSPPETVILEKE